MQVAFLSELQSLRKDSLSQVETIHQLETKCSQLHILAEELKTENDSLHEELRSSLQSLIMNRDEVMELQKKVSSLESATKQTQVQGTTVSLMSDTIRLMEAKIANMTLAHEQQLQELRAKHEQDLREQAAAYEQRMNQELANQEQSLQMRSFSNIALYMKTEILQEQHKSENVEWLNDVSVNELYEEARHTGVKSPSWLSWIRTKCISAADRFRQSRPRKASSTA